MTIAVFGFGTLFKMEDPNVPGTYLTVAEVTNIGGPGISVDTLDATSHSSVNAWKEFIAALIDAGEVSLDIHYVPDNATHNNTTGMLSRLTSRAKTNFRLVWPNVAATTWNFAGFCTAFNPTAPTGDFLSASLTVKLTGQPTLV